MRDFRCHQRDDQADCSKHNEEQGDAAVGASPEPVAKQVHAGAIHHEGDENQLCNEPDQESRDGRCSLLDFVKGRIQAVMRYLFVR